MMNTKTMVIDSISHSNSRTELRLDPYRVYSGNLRVGNVGCYITSANPPSFVEYNRLSGVYGLIKNMYLYDNTTLLDQITDFSHVMAFRNCLKSGKQDNINALNYSLKQWLNATNNSYDIEHNMVSGTTTSNGLDTQPKKRLKCLDMDETNKVESDYRSTFGAWLNLTEIFDFLNKLVYNVGNMNMNLIDTNLFTGLRVIIEWKTGTELNGAFQGDTTNLTFSMLRPELYVDEMFGFNGKLGNLNFNYSVYEIDKLMTSASSQAGIIVTKQRLNAFNNKFLNKLLLMNVNPNDETSTNIANNNVVKADGSLCYTSERLQLSVNGANLLDFQGIDSDARRLALLEQSWGALSIPHGAWRTSLNKSSELLTNDVKNMVGKVSYTGLVVQDRISEIQLEHSRVVSGATDSFMLMAMGEVIKSISSSNGTYNVGYA